jgi:hypothetical protein
MVWSKTVVAACLAVAGGAAPNVGSAADAAVDPSPRHHDRQTSWLGGRTLGVNHHEHHVGAVSRFKIADVGDNTNISREVRTHVGPDGAPTATDAVSTVTPVSPPGTP